MGLRWDSREIDERHRAEAIRSLFRERWDAADFTILASPGAVRAQVTGWDLGQVRISSVAAVPVIAERRRRTTARGEDQYLLVILQRSGSSVIRRGDRELVLRAGDLTVYGGDAVPYTHAFRAEVDIDVVRLPLEYLGLSPADVEAVSAVGLLERTPLARIARNLLADLAAHPLVPTAEASLAGPVVDILRMALEDATDGATGRPRDHRADEIVRFVVAHLGDPDLGAPMIARAHHISERQLYSVLAQADIHLSRFIRRRRLRAARAALSGSSSAEVPIGLLAQRYGFVSASHFSRRFREEFGMSPREWRARHASEPALATAAPGGRPGL